MWKNKHIVVALLVAPVLALIAYFAVDAMVSEKPHVAIEGESYPLRVHSNCRFPSGACDLRNGDVKLRLTRLAGEVWLLESELALRGALVSTAGGAAPSSFAAVDESSRRWRVPVDREALRRGDPLRLVVAADESRYYAEIPVAFVSEEGAPER